MAGLSSAWCGLALSLVVGLTRPALADSAPPGPHRTIARRLRNGLEVVLSEARDQPVFSLAVRYRLGSRDDPTELAELAHLVEHLSFRDPRRPGRDGTEVADLVGVSSNASTAEDQTLYVSSGPRAALSEALRLERERMAFALAAITAQDVVSERRTLDNERSTMRADRIGGMFWQLVGSALYPPRHPYAPRPERGCILNCELQHVQWLMQRGYRPDNARLVVVGDFDASAMLESVDRSFGSIANPGVRLPALEPIPALAGPSHITITAPVARSRVHLYWSIPQPLRSERWVLQVLSSQFNERLSRELLDGGGLASDVQLYIDEAELGWLWCVNVDLLPGIDPKFVERRVLAQIERLKGQALSVDSARQRVLMEFLATWDSLDARASLLARNSGMEFDLSKSIAELGAVSASDLARVARQFLFQKPRLSVYVRRALDAPLRGELYREPE